jgi:hypothetical protein
MLADGTFYHASLRAHVKRSKFKLTHYRPVPVTAFGRAMGRAVVVIERWGSTGSVFPNAAL